MTNYLMTINLSVLKQMCCSCWLLRRIANKDLANQERRFSVANKNLANQKRQFSVANKDFANQKRRFSVANKNLPNQERRLSLRLIDDVTDQLNVRQKPGLLLTIDYCQAFDTISKDFIIHTLKKKNGFGPDVVKWVSVLMADAKSCVAYCGWLSEYFAVEAGIRQGCPFSSLAFVLAVELLAIKIRQCENIKRLNYWKARYGLLESIIKNCTIYKRYNVFKR